MSISSFSLILPEKDKANASSLKEKKYFLFILFNLEKLLHFAASFLFTFSRNTKELEIIKPSLTGLAEYWTKIFNRHLNLNSNFQIQLSLTKSLKALKTAFRLLIPIWRPMMLMVPMTYWALDQRHYHHQIS